MKQEIKAYNNVLELIGNTPLIKLSKVAANFPGSYFAKVEAFNPGHSTKDRIALYIIEDAEKKGILKPGDTIIETTSGNTGFSLAMVSIIKGYDCILAVSSKSSKDKIDMLRSMGAKVYVCPANVSADDERSYYNVAKRLHEETKGSVYINQYFNELNVDALLIEYLTNGLEDAFAVSTFAPGYNSQNQVYIFDKQTNWMIQRSVKQSATLLINKDRGYNITLVQDGTTVKLQSADTTTNKIFIKQGAN